MAALVWDQTGEHLYETGTKNGILFVSDGANGWKNGVAWNGLTGVSETPSGADENGQYADDVKYLALRGTEDFGGTITCFTYPDEFGPCNGEETPIAGFKFGQQSRKAFCFVYKSTEGNDTLGNDYGEKIHIIYNATASPSQRDYKSINNSPEGVEFSFEFTTTPVDVVLNGVEYKKTSMVTISKSALIADAVAKAGDTGAEAARTSAIAKFNAVWTALAGSADKEPTLQTPAQVFTALSA